METAYTNWILFGEAEESSLNKKFTRLELAALYFDGDFLLYAGGASENIMDAWILLRNENENYLGCIIFRRLHMQHLCKFLPWRGYREKAAGAIT